MANGKKKDWFSERLAAAPKRAGQYGLTCAGAVVGSAVIATDKIEKVSPKVRAFVAVGLGLASNLLNPDDWSNSALTGIGAAGSIVSAAAVTKKPAMFGVSEKTAPMSGTDGTEGTDGAEEFDWVAAANKAGTSGTDTDEPADDIPTGEAMDDDEVLAEDVIDNLV
jgi:hypothetical protein